MADLTNQLQATAGATVGPDIDPNFNQTVLLLHGDGTNGAQNNTFLDGSTNNFTITRNGNTTQGTFTPFSAVNGKWATYFRTNGTSGSDMQRLQSSISTAFSTNNFTIELWIYLVATNSVSILLDMRTASGTAFSINIPNGRLVFTGASTIIASSVATEVPRNTWTHVAAVRSGTGTNQVTMYINGVAVATGTSADDFTTTSVTLANRFSSPPNSVRCYLSNVRISNIARSISVPTAPYTSDANTLLLLCQSNRNIDNGPDNQSVTTPDTVKPSIRPFSPFAPLAAYSASTNGGSGYFDGTGDYLSIADAAGLRFGTGNFTIQAWIYRSVAGVVHSIASKGGASTGWVFQIHSDNKLRFTQTTTNIDSTGTIPINAWTHVAVVREGTGTNQTKLYINGVNDGQATVTTDFNQTEQLNIGADRGNANPMNGYISGFKYVVGTAETITVPTTPPTGGTALLNFNNAGIFDSTAKNNIETVADAQVDTSTKKFGTGSMEFDGTGDWLLIADNPDQRLGTGNFTIEFWVYLATGDIGSARGLVAKGGASTGWLVSLDSSEKVVFTYTTSTITSSGAITTNAWNHIAVVREGTGSNLTKIYINGTNDGTGTVSTDFNQTEVMYVGCNRAAGDPMKGFIDDLRITKGVARYTAAFTAPTKAFADQ